MDKFKNMLRAIQLASKGGNAVSPNPLVGCLIENNGIIVGKGWHQKHGDDHAEIIALREAKQLAKGATMYINLEPCSHYGKTPPCTKAIIAAGISKIYIATRDPNHLVNGKGIKELQDAGIEIDIGLGAVEATYLNRRYFYYITNKKPYIILKWAMSLDGKIASADGNSQWLSGIAARRYSHKIRNSIDAILIGANTAVNDNPQLTVRYVKKCLSQPIRVVLDTKGRLSGDLKLFSSNLPGKTMVATADDCSSEYLKMLESQKIKTFILKKDHRNKIPLKALVVQLGKIGITSVLVEGGAEVFTSFIEEELANEIMVYITPKILGGKKALSPILREGKSTIPEGSECYLASVKKFQDDVLLTYIFQSPRR